MRQERRWGDELFGGYRLYLAALFDYYTKMFIPFSFRKGIAIAAEYLPEKSMSKIKRQLLKFRLDLYDAFVERCSEMYFKERDRRHLLSNDVIMCLNNKFSEPELSRRNYLIQRKENFISRMTYADMKTYLPDDIMVKVDRASMLVSLEVRAPLLDYRIAEFSFKNIPGDLKVKRITTKYLLKKLARKILPKELDINRKWGFAVPISKWFKGPLTTHIKEILLGDRLVFSLWRKEYLGNGCRF